MPRLVVVLPLHPLMAGAGFALSHWPLHVTVAPTFIVDADLATVVSAIEPVLVGQPPLRVSAGPEEGFGRSGRIPVTVIQPSGELLDLHRLLVASLLDIGAEFDDPDFVGAGYRPHVTATRTAKSQPDDALVLRQAAIVDMAPEGDGRLRRVVWARALAPAPTLTMQSLQEETS